MESFTDDWTLLKDVYKMLVEHNVLQTPVNEPVVRFEHPVDLQTKLDLPIEEAGISAKEIKEICEQIICHSVKTGHPHFYNQLFGRVDSYGLAGSWITEALNTSQYTFEVSPVFTLIENEIIQQFCKIFGYETGDGIFSPGGSMSNMYSMALARYRSDPSVKRTGNKWSNPLVCFTSIEAHYSITKSVHWLGLGTDNLVHVETDEFGRMICKDLEEKIVRALNQNKRPFYVNATAGTTVVGAFDDLNGIADICRKYHLWMHVDACLGGSVILSQKHKHLLSGIERSDSLAWNPHKTLGAPLQCAMLLVKQKGLLQECNSASADYLFQQDKFYDVSYDTGDKSVQCGRKVDAFKLWLMLKARGLSTFEHLLDNAMEMSSYLWTSISSKRQFRPIIGQPFQYTNVCFWYIPIGLRGLEETNEWWDRIYTVAPLIKEMMVKSGTLMVGYSPLPHKKKGNFFRMALTCQPPVTHTDIDFVLNQIDRLGSHIVI
ncbi:cysteine sulfinic acid decarboxylase [Bradysia coprophila]|uniref:cysteine sulfinic acid decarboxylase n=1 Tax=Bradysia coprophila TaxID=38358 RepID=UPI00187D8D0B|nr:cysteine sulfinic acid decarboxylase [Bradysia coprophila]XP_037037479.1 cysteine sulfinic acid decarboxylase [Bradysia coprophila]